MPLNHSFLKLTDCNSSFPILKKDIKDFCGIVRLFKDLSRQAEIDYVIDLHDVLRSKILRLLFRIFNVPVSVIDKGRKEKRMLINGKKKARLKHSVDRYCDVFARAGFPVVPSQGKWIVPSPETKLKIRIHCRNEGSIEYWSCSLCKT